MEHFFQEITRLGKDFAVLETYPSDFQQEIIEWFFVRVQGSIEEIHCEEGHIWSKAVSVYLDRLLLEQHKPKLESSVESEEAIAESMGTIEPGGDELGSEDFDFSDFLQQECCASWNCMVWKTILGMKRFGRHCK